MFEKLFETLRKNHPLIHNITNYVTANDCANILLACGASPIMADDENEVWEITSACSGLNINLGTLKSHAVSAMLIAGKRSNELNHPVILDPVGIGASKLRSDSAVKLLSDLKFSVIRGNLSEIKALISGCNTANGVDADVKDEINGENLEEIVAFAKSAAKKIGSVIAITGTIDVVANEAKAYCIRNGHPMMSAVTGTGCQLSALITAFVSANPLYPLDATAAAVCAMGYAGEIAYNRLTDIEGNASYRNYVIDAIYNMTPKVLKEGAKYEVR